MRAILFEYLLFFLGETPQVCKVSFVNSTDCLSDCKHFQVSKVEERKC